MGKRFKLAVASVIFAGTTSYLVVQASTASTTSVDRTTDSTVCYQKGKTGEFGDRVICAPGPMPANARRAVPMVGRSTGDKAMP